ncbi:hypothetical protein MVEN_01339600 [Mycena venus]|uniref:Uncharacterized protein n=1 Tax=Mycena venus TaxID=2733690 RepID=A0A8H7CTZ4_9AGAR|nr:hypothetical protein MVEN_01339600 [Mycena venus]
MGMGMGAGLAGSASMGSIGGQAVRRKTSGGMLGASASMGNIGAGGAGGGGASGGLRQQTSGSNLRTGGGDGSGDGNGRGRGGDAEEEQRGCVPAAEPECVGGGGLRRKSSTASASQGTGTGTGSGGPSPTGSTTHVNRPSSTHSRAPVDNEHINFLTPLDYIPEHTKLTSPHAPPRGPPPPLVTVRTRAREQGHGHARSVSASGLAVSIGGSGGALPSPPQPIRKGSEGSSGVDSPPLSVTPALGILNAGTPQARPFVPPPPPPPLVTVRSNSNLSPNPQSAGSSGSGSGSGSGPKTHTSTGSGSTARGSPAPSPIRTSPPASAIPPARTASPAPMSIAQRTASPPPPPPPPLSMAAVLRSRGGASANPSSAYPSPYPASVTSAGGHSASPASAHSGGPQSAYGGPASGYPSAASASASASSASTPSSARSTPSGFAWRYSGDGGSESPMTAATTPATSREGGAWGGGGDKYELPERKSVVESERRWGGTGVGAVAASPLTSEPLNSAALRSPSSPQNKRERRRLRLHSPIDVEQLDLPREEDAHVPPLTPPIHSHPLEDEGEGSTGPDSAVDPPDDDGRGWLAALEGEELDPDDDHLDLYDGGYLDDPNLMDTRDLILSDSSDEEEDNMSDLDRASSANVADARSFDSPAASVFNDARSTFSRARSTRSRRKRRNTRAAPPPVPLGSAAGLHRPRARSADSSILAFGDVGLAPSEMWRMEQAARAAKAAAGAPVQEMRYVYQAAAARLPASVPPPPALLLGRGSDGSSQYDSASASISGHGHGSSESGQPHGASGYYASGSTSKSSLPEPPTRKETLKLSKKEKKEREKAEKEREKAMRKSSMPHRTSFSLLRGGGGTANSSAEALMIRGTTERTSSSSGGSDEIGRPQRANKPALFRSLYGDPTRGR